MNYESASRTLIGLAALTLSAFSAACGGTSDDRGSVAIGSAAQELAVVDCTEELAACVRDARLPSALVACNAQYAECLASSASDTVTSLPGQVVDTLSTLEGCADDVRQCVSAASSPSELLACQEGQTTCVAGALDVGLPSLPAGGAAGCAEDAVDCARGASSVSELTACGEAFAGCAGGVATSTLDDLPVPGALADAADGALACAGDLRDCVRAAQTPSELATCQQAQAGCVADLLDVDLPSLPDLDLSGATSCAEEAISCVSSAGSAADLVACGEDFADCTQSAAGALVPDQLRDTVGAMGACTEDLRTCVAAAQTPGDLLACQESQARCVANALDVSLPSAAGDLVDCAETATECVSTADTLADLSACAEGFASCATEGVPETGVSLVDCQAQFTRCLALNPFNSIQCAEEARQCNGL